MTNIYNSMEAAVSKLRLDCEGREAIKISEAQLKSRLVSPGAKSHPIVIIEGADGTGKSTLVTGLRGQLGERVTLLKTPPRELAHLRSYFDGQEDVQLRRAFYLLANYVCAAQIHVKAATGPVVVDRFWPSTVCYGIAHDLKANPEDVAELLEMPRDLMELLPNGHPIAALCLELSEEERARRVRTRASNLAGVEITKEEEELERSQAHRLRLCAAYRSVRFAGEPLTVCDASGSPQDVLQRALSVIESAVKEHARLEPTSVNWHMTRRCNYQCLFCFHTNTSSFFLPQDEPNGMAETKRCFKRLAEAGMRKLNFSGGEPFLYPKQLGELCKFCKEELNLESVSIVSNGSKIKRQWLEKYGAHVDILAVSCDSFVEATNMATGRGKGMHIAQLEQVKAWCDEFHVPFKLNSVINANNVGEDMTEAILRLRPMRWKVFQCLLLEGENVGAEALRNAAPLVISDQQFEEFVQRHRIKGIDCIVPENNEAMRDSYLILDEKLRFLNCTGNSKAPSKSIRDVSVMCALKEAGFDSDMFRKRGGVYAWSRSAALPRQSGGDIEDAPGSVAGGGVGAKGKRPVSTVRPGVDPKRLRLLTVAALAGTSFGLLVALRLLQQRRRP